MTFCQKVLLRDLRDLSGKKVVSTVYRKSTLMILLTLIFVSFFGTLAASAWMFPHNYDWRYRVISNLLSPRDNPEHYQLASCGVALTGLLMLPFAAYLQRSLGAVAPRIAYLTAGSFALGMIALICAAVVVPRHAHELLGFRRPHEILGRSAAGFLAIGMLCGSWCAWKDRRGGSQRLFWVWSLVTLVPLTGLLCSEGLLLLTRLQPSIAAPIRRALRHSVFWHLGFWEWTGAVAVFVFLCATVFLTPQSDFVKHEQPLNS